MKCKRTTIVVGGLLASMPGLSCATSCVTSGERCYYKGECCLAQKQRISSGWHYIELKCHTLTPSHSDRKRCQPKYCGWLYEKKDRGGSSTPMHLGRYNGEFKSVVAPMNKRAQSVEILRQCKVTVTSLDMPDEKLVLKEQDKNLPAAWVNKITSYQCECDEGKVCGYIYRQPNFGGATKRFSFDEDLFMEGIERRDTIQVGERELNLGWTKASGKPRPGCVLDIKYIIQRPDGTIASKNMTFDKPEEDLISVATDVDSSETAVEEVSCHCPNPCVTSGNRCKEGHCCSTELQRLSNGWHHIEMKCHAFTPQETNTKKCEPEYCGWLYDKKYRGGSSMRMYLGRYNGESKSVVASMNKRAQSVEILRQCKVTVRSSDMPGDKLVLRGLDKNLPTAWVNKITSYECECDEGKVCAYMYRKPNFGGVTTPFSEEEDFKGMEGIRDTIQVRKVVELGIRKASAKPRPGCLLDVGYIIQGPDGKTVQNLKTFDKPQKDLISVANDPFNSPLSIISIMHVSCRCSADE